MLGLVRVAQGNLPAAEHVFAQAFAKHPDFTVAGRNLAQVYLGEGRPDDAVSVYRAIIARDDSDLVSRQSMAEIMISQQNYAGAITELQRATAINPANPKPALTIVNLYASQKNWSQAQQTMRPLMQQFPNNLDVLDMMGRLQMATGDNAGAQATYRRATSAAPNVPLVFDRYADALAATGDWGGARDALRKAAALDPQNSNAKQKLVFAEYKLGGKAPALSAAKSLLVAGDSPSLPAQWTAAALVQDGKYPDALAMLAEASQASPSEGLTVQQAVLLARSGAAPKGVVLLKAWIAKHPDDLAAPHALGELDIAAADYPGAEAAFQAIVVKSPNDALALNNLAWLYQRRGDSRAIEYAQRAYALAPLLPAVADTYGWILLATGDIDHATRYLRMASIGLPDDPAVEYHLAAALNRMGKTADARQLLQKAIGNPAAFDGKQQASDLLRSIGGNVN
jgi:putative PEP-CTERM system TPR-repeat lipoprotein